MSSTSSAASRRRSTSPWTGARTRSELTATARTSTSSASWRRCWPATRRAATRRSRGRLAFGLDWVQSNPRAKSSTPIEAWVGQGRRRPHPVPRLPAAGRRLRGPPRRRESRLLLDSLDKHGRVLAANRNYTADNHGLFVDLGLLRLTGELPILTQAPEWRELARRRFERTLRGRLSQGVWLEHSSAYQFLAIRPLESFVAELRRRRARGAAGANEGGGGLVRAPRRSDDAVR